MRRDVAQRHDKPSPRPPRAARHTAAAALDAGRREQRRSVTIVKQLDCAEQVEHEIRADASPAQSAGLKGHRAAPRVPPCGCEPWAGVDDADALRFRTTRAAEPRQRRAPDRRRLSDRASLSRRLDRDGRHQPGFGQELTSASGGPVQRQRTLHRGEGHVRESAFGLDALTVGALLRGDLERASAGQLASPQPNTCTSGHWRPLARWIVVSSTACSSCRRGSPRAHRGRPWSSAAYSASVLPDASATCLLEHLEFDPLGALKGTRRAPRRPTGSERIGRLG